MGKNIYRSRLIDRKVEEYLEVFGALCIEGPKWCGKTWTSSYHCNSEIYIGNPNGNFQNRKLAELSPTIVLEGETPRMIDEWQEVPTLWDAVRYKVDERGEKGQFILTGSSTPNHKGILHSGAGRIGKLRMRPMSLYESGDSSGSVSLELLCKGQINTSMTGEVELLEIAKLIVRGGWPGNLRTDDKKIGLLPAEYLNAVIDDDVFRIDGVSRDTSKMRLLLRSLARNESTTCTNNKLCGDIKSVDNEDISIEAIQVYLDIFKRLFLLDNLKPFAPNVRSSIRVKQSEKRHFSDPSLACAVLGITPARLINDLETFGFLFEALCERDIQIYANTFGASVYHYQDYNNDEIDTIVEFPDGSWHAFEIKLGANQIDRAAENLLKIQKKIVEKGGIGPSTLCVICGLSNAAYRREDGVFVVPITALRD